MKFKRLLLVLLLTLCAMPGQSAIDSVSQVASRTFFGRRYANFANIAGYLKLRYSTGANLFRLVSPAGSTLGAFYPDKRTATIKNMPIVLNFAPTYQNGTAYLSWSDFSSTLLPLFQRSALKRHTPITIVIDPGHGGSDPGAIGRISREKNVTLSIAKELKTELGKRTFTVNGKKTGFRVLMTRTGDTTISLEQRAAFCNRNGGQLFVSIHADAAAPSASGIGTFSLTPPGAPSYNTSKVESGSAPGHNWCNNSLYLSYCVQKNLASGIREADNRGLKRARFSVLRNTNCPAILVETGFISNTAEERNLNSAAYRRRLAKAIADGIVEYQTQVKSK